jgi:hypothetical protein
MIRDIDSYLAGIFDGEGCISAQHKSNYHYRRAYSRLVVSVGMINKSILLLFKERFGGSVKRYKNGKYNYYIYQWFISGSKAEKALLVFAELCIEKSGQAKLALELTQYLKALKSRGKRPIGSIYINDSEFLRRAKICDEIKKLKSQREYVDA